MKKILLTSGCSFTDRNFESDFHPDMDTRWPMWPELVAKKLNMDCINLGQSGAGNEYIYFTLLDEIIKRDNIGLVIAGWTQSQRKDWRNKQRWNNNSRYCNKSINTYGNNDMYAYVDKSLRYYYSLQQVCKSKKIPFKQFQMLHLFRGYTYDPISNEQNLKIEIRKELLEYIHDSPYFNKIDDNFLGWPTDTSLGGYNIKQKVLGGYTKEALKNNVSKKDSHPNAKGQEMIAEFLYARL
tara:strand:+ start:465 stop:1181 length:717 start_codon:yes stop_codon:yes gene_type:complete